MTPSDDSRFDGSRCRGGHRRSGPRDRARLCPAARGTGSERRRQRPRRVEGGRSVPTPARRGRWPTRSSPPAARRWATRTTCRPSRARRRSSTTALREFGRIDIVVNNAGIVRWGDLPDADLASLRNTLDVHLVGSFNVTRAAWPHMVEQEYGRVVMTTSTGMFGLRGNLAYAAAKAGVVGLMRNMKLSGRRTRDHGEPSRRWRRHAWVAPTSPTPTPRGRPTWRRRSWPRSWPTSATRTAR